MTIDTMITDAMSCAGFYDKQRGARNKLKLGLKHCADSEHRRRLEALLRDLDAEQVDPQGEVEGAVNSDWSTCSSIKSAALCGEPHGTVLIARFRIAIGINRFSFCFMFKLTFSALT